MQLYTVNNSYGQMVSHTGCDDINRPKLSCHTSKVNTAYRLNRSQI